MPCSAGGGALMTLNVSARINRPLSVGSQCSRRFRVRSSVLACVLLDRKVYLTDARTHRDRYTQISGRRQRRRVYARFTVASRVVYSTLHSARTTHTHARPALCTRAQTCVLGTKILSVHFARFASYCAGVQVFICNACICGISSERTSCTLRVGGRPWSQSVVARLACERGTHAGGGAALGGGGNSHPVSFE